MAENAVRFPREVSGGSVHIPTMKRREFLNLAAGSSVAAVLPLPKMVAAAPIKQAPKGIYVWAVAMARAGNPISVETLGHALKVPANQANALIGRLVQRGVVGMPNAMGIARAANPVFKSGAVAPPVSTVSKSIGKRSAGQIKDVFEDLVDTSPAPKDEELSPSSDDSERPEALTEVRSTE